jgi:hypothetical protein
LIDLLDLKGCVVTIDAAGCQKDIAAQIVGKEADYVLALKENQPTLHAEVSDFFLRQIEADNAEGKLRHHRQVETGHGRTETRETFVAALPEELVAAGAWVGLSTLVMVIRRSVDHATAKASDEVRSAGAGQAPGRGGPQALGDRERPALGVGRGLQRGSVAPAGPQRD